MKTIILVESDPMLRQLYELELSEEGYDIIVAKTDKEGLHILKTQSADLFITDIQQCDERTACQTDSLFQRIKCPIIINTGYSANLISHFPFKKIAYVWKSSDIKKLKSQILRMLAGAENFVIGRARAQMPLCPADSASPAGLKRGTQLRGNF